MSAQPISAELLAAYQNTLYRVAAPGQDWVLRVGEASPEMAQCMAQAGAAGAVFITAWNPLGQFLPLAENAQANAALRAELAQIATTVLPGVGSSPDGRFQEDSFLAYPISRSVAAQLCCRYRQNAIVFIAPSGVPELLFHPDVALP